MRGEDTCREPVAIIGVSQPRPRAEARPPPRRPEQAPANVTGACFAVQGHFSPPRQVFRELLRVRRERVASDWHRALRALYSRLVPKVLPAEGSVLGERSDRLSVGVAIFHDDMVLLEDVADAIDRAEGMHLVTVNEVRAGTDVALAGGAPLRSGLTSARALVVLSRGSPPSEARAGMEAGARGWVRWPEDAADLARVVALAAAQTSAEPTGGRLVIVAGARGGAGATTVAALIAATVDGSLVIDLAGDGGQLAFAPDGVEPGGLSRALASPLPDVVVAAAQPHAAGRALYAEPAYEPVLPSAVDVLVAAARRVAPLVVVDAGRLRTEDAARDGAFVAVLGGDVASLRSARAFLDAGGEAPTFVLNRIRRRSLRAAHVERALGVRPAVVLAPDRRMARAADLGVLPRRAVRSLVGVAPE